MRRHAKASTAGSTQRQARGLGRFFRGADATRGASPDVKGSSAPAVRGFAAVLTSVVLLALLAAPAIAAEPPEYVSSFGPDGTAATGFDRPGALAVDQQANTLYVIEHSVGALLKFDTQGNPVPFGGSAPYIVGNEITGLSFAGKNGETQVATDSASHTIYVNGDGGESIQAFQENGEPSLFTAGPGNGTNKIGGFTELLGVAVDADGNIYASDYVGVVKIYAPSGEQITQFETATPANIAVDTNGAVYVNRRFDFHTGNVLKFTPSEFPVTATTIYTAASEPFNSFESYAVAVDPTTNDVYITGGFFNPKVAWYDENGTLLATFAAPGEEGAVARAEGVAIKGSSGRVFVSDSPDNPGGGEVEIFDPKVIFVGPPSVESTLATQVAADSATLHAEINPNALDTTYRFEYGLGDCAVSACASVPVGGATIGDGHKVVAVTQEIAGLQAGTTYHYRVVAENSEGITEGPGRTFITQLSGLGFELADRRAWEMVSPPNKHGGRLVGSFNGQIQAAADGSGLAYLSIGSIETEPEGNRIFEPSTALARRGAGGWRSKDITLPNEHVTELATGAMTEYKLFSPDLSKAMLEPRGTTLLSPQASERAPNLRENTEPPTYTPLVTGKEGFANVPPGTEFGGGASGNSSFVRFAGATADFDHVALWSSVPLAAGAVAKALYAWSAGQLRPVSLLPASEGGAMVEAPAFVGSGAGSIRHAISADGSRIFWGTGNYTSAGNVMTALYMRDTVAEETVRLDVVEPGASGSGETRPAFQGASADGSVAFFTDFRQLTADSGASFDTIKSIGKADLYRCELSHSATECELSDLTPQVGGESADVQGIVSALSEDATSLYFVAKSVLDAAPNQVGDSAIAGEPNLYLWREGQGTRFIATLSTKDSPAWGAGGNSPNGQVSQLNATGSPSGRYFSFMSERSLTGYDNRDAQSGEPVEEVFRYDALADRLDCISCNPSEANPAGPLMEVNPVETPLVDQRANWPGRRVAAILPQVPVAFQGGASHYRPRAVLDNGRVFFNAIDSLVPADSNREWDVYQHEPTGVGECSASSAGAAIARSAGGCVSLISSGTAEEEAAFLDASATGDDVFFLTSAMLSVTDEDSERDIYDARVDGVLATLAPNAECLGEACQPAAIAPNDPTPASATFKGQGNQKPNARKRCAKGKRQVRRNGKARCVARKQRGQAKRAGKSARVSR